MTDIDDIRNLFLKGGYQLEDVPRPIGNADPAQAFRVAPDFARVLELLIEKLPTELELPILNILRDNGITEIRVPAGTVDNSGELLQIDEMISQIQAMAPGEGGQSQAIYNGKYDAAKDATILCEGSAEGCTNQEQGIGSNGSSSHVIGGHIKNFQPTRHYSVAEQMQIFQKDKQELDELIADAEQQANGPLEPKAKTKLVNDLNQISELINEIESMAEINLKAAKENNCQTSEGRHDYRNEERDTKLGWTNTGGQTKEQVIDTIDQLIAEIRQLEHKRQKESIPTLRHDIENIEIIAINDLIEKMEFETSKLVQRKDHSGDELKQIEDIMADIQNLQTENSKPKIVIEKKMDQDLKAIDTILNDLLEHDQIYAHAHPPIMSKEAEELKTINSMLEHINKAEIDSILAKQQKPDYFPSDLGHHNPRHGSPDEEFDHIDSIIKDMQKMGNLQKSNNPSHHSQLAQYPKDELDTLDDVIREIGQIAKQEQKHLENESNQSKRRQLNTLMREMETDEVNAEVDKNQIQSDESAHMTQLNRILNDLEQESNFERDLQSAFEQLHKHNSNSDNRQTLQKLNNLMGDTEYEKNMNDFHTYFKNDHAHETLNKQNAEMQELHKLMNEAKVNAIMNTLGETKNQKVSNAHSQGFPQIGRDRWTDASGRSSPSHVGERRLKTNKRKKLALKRKKKIRRQ